VVLSKVFCQRDSLCADSHFHSLAPSFHSFHAASPVAAPWCGPARRAGASRQPPPPPPKQAVPRRWLPVTLRSSDWLRASLFGFATTGQPSNGGRVRGAAAAPPPAARAEFQSAPHLSVREVPTTNRPPLLFHTPRLTSHQRLTMPRLS